MRNFLNQGGSCWFHAIAVPLCGTAQGTCKEGLPELFVRIRDTWLKIISQMVNNLQGAQTAEQHKGNRIVVMDPHPGVKRSSIIQQVRHNGNPPDPNKDP